MRPRFLLYLGDVGQGRGAGLDARLAPDLPRHVEAPGMRLLLGERSDILVLPTIDGWIIGSLFAEGGRTRLCELRSAEQLAIMSSGGERLIERYSGAYLACWRGAGDGRFMLLRDPSACVPIYGAFHGQAMAVSSDLDFLWRAGFTDLAISAPDMARHLCFAHVPSPTTCLTDVRELGPGARWTIGEGEPELRQLWQPRRFVERRSDDVALVAEAVDAVIAGQTVGAETVGIELSGGLDSSIVAASLGATGIRQIALHLVPDARDGDERVYARAIADRYGIRLHEVPISQADFSALAPPERLTVRPTGFAQMHVIDRKLAQARREIGLDLMFTGGGGDSIFNSLHSTAPVVDALRHGGLATGRRAAEDLAMVTGAHRWLVWRHLMRRWLHSHIHPWQWPADTSLLGMDQAAAPRPHPWGIETLDPGARAHAAGILRIQTMLDAHDRTAEDGLLFPLMAQPVIEACLSIASWRWIDGGRDRAAARQAYAGRVPDLILYRSGKGRYDSMIVPAFEAARPALRELLLDGWLAAQGIIDRKAVDVGLRTLVRANSSLYPRLLALADAELWARSILLRGAFRPAR